MLTQTHDCPPLWNAGGCRHHFLLYESDVLLNDNPRGSLIDKDVLLNTEILFKGKRQSLTDILFDHTLHQITLPTGCPSLKFPKGYPVFRLMIYN